MLPWSDLLKSLLLSHEQLLLGWLLGILSPALIEGIRRGRRTKALSLAIAEELHELQHQMAAKTFFLRLRAGKLDDETIAFFSKIAAAYRGDERFERVLKVLPALRAMPVEARSEHDATRGVSLSKMDAVLLEVHRNEIVQFSIHEQRWLLKLLQRLGYWNEQVSFLKGQFDRTFASPGEATRAKIITNLENGYAQLADEAVWIASYIENAPKRFQVSSR